MSLEYEPASEPLHISVKQLFLSYTKWLERRRAVVEMVPP